MQLHEAQDYILRRLKLFGAEDVVITASQDNSFQQKFVKNEIIITKDWVDETISVFVALGKRGEMRTGSTSVPFETREKIDSRLDKLIKFVKITPPNKYYHSIAKGPFKYRSVEGIYDKKVLELGNKATDITVNSISSALDEGAKLCAGSFDYSFGEQRLLTSNGVDVTEPSTDLKLSIRVFADEGSSHKIAASSTLKDFNPFGVSKIAARQAVRASKLDKLNVDPGKFNILFDPLPFAVLVNQAGHAASMFSVETESSFFEGLMGKKVGSAGFTLYDHGNLPGGLASGGFDAEGRPTQKTTVVSSGTLKSYLHNTSTANRHGKKSTGNAGILSPVPTNLVVPPGKVAPNKLVSTLKDGLYVTNIWYTRFQNYKTGDFSTIPRDAIFLVKKGEIVGRINNVRISDNMVNVLKNIKALGSRSTVENIMGWEAGIPAVVPSAIIKNINITKPEKK